MNKSNKGRRQEQETKADLLEIINCCMRGAASKGEFFVFHPTKEYYFHKLSSSNIYERRLVILCDSADFAFVKTYVEKHLNEKGFFLKKELDCPKGPYKADLVFSGHCDNKEVILLIQCKVSAKK